MEQEHDINPAKSNYLRVILANKIHLHIIGIAALVETKNYQYGVALASFSEIVRRVLTWKGDISERNHDTEDYK